jgi:hypothetical protein
MGYTTDFWGELKLTPALTKEQADYLTAFSDTRRMKRDISKLKDMIPWAVPSFGVDGEFYVGAKDDGQHGQTDDDSVLDHNNPPRTQPSLWCQWVPGNDGRTIEWDGGEKFYEYEGWLEYIIRCFLEPWGVVANGTIEWQGEDSGDMGRLEVENNTLTVKHAVISWK